MPWKVLTRVRAPSRVQERVGLSLALALVATLGLADVVADPVVREPHEHREPAAIGGYRSFFFIVFFAIGRNKCSAGEDYERGCGDVLPKQCRHCGYVSTGPRGT